MDEMDSSKCPYVELMQVPSNCDRMRNEQKRYYAYFRTILDKGRIKGDWGYFNLLVMECLTTDEGRKKLYRYLFRSRNGNFAEHARDYIRDLSVYCGSFVSSGYDSIDMGPVFTKMFLPRFSPSLESDYLCLSRGLRGYYSFMAVNSMRLNHAFKIADQYFMEKFGESIGQHFARDEASVSLNLFDLLPAKEQPRRIVCYRSPDWKGFSKLFFEVLGVCDGYGAGSEYPDLCYRLERAMEDDTLRYENIREDVVGGLRILSFDDGEIEIYPAPARPSFYRDSRAIIGVCDGSPTAEAVIRDLEWVSASRSDRGVFWEVVDLTPEGIIGKDYYLFWRDRLLEGKFYDFDVGCLLVRCMEMVKEGAAFSEIMSFLTDVHGLGSEYRNEFLSMLMAEASTVGRIPIASEVAASDRDLSCFVLRRAIDGQRQPLPAEYFWRFLKVSPPAGSYEECWTVFKRVFSKILTSKCESGAGWLKGYGMLATEDVHPRMFSVGRATFRMPSLNRIDGSFSRELLSLMDFVVSSVHMRADNGRRRRNPVMCFGVNVTPLVNEAIDRLNEPQRDEPETPLELDMAAVSKA